MDTYFQLLSKNKNFDIEHLRNKAFLVTGATGLIGSLLTKYLLFLNQHYKTNIRLILSVRDIQKAEKLLPSSENITYLVSNIENLTQQNIPHGINYIVHCAAPTKSKTFIQAPVETLDTIVNGTRSLLQAATAMYPEKVIFLSSMEVYGVLNDNATTEDKIGYIDFLNERSSYSEGKRLAELYCHSFYTEYNLPIVIARSAMCFGPGILSNETRAYKTFIDQARQGNDVILKSKGATKLNYTSTLDIINSILLLIEKGQPGEAYNICNDDSGVYTILDMAKDIASVYNVSTHIELDEKAGLAPDNLMVLENKKIKKLGFKNIYSIKDTIKETIQYVENQ